MTDQEDRTLLEAALAGDASQMRALVERLVPVVEARVMSVLRRYRHREQVAQTAPDFTQHVFLMLFRNDGRCLRAWEVGREASLPTFVALVAEREGIAILRRDRGNPWTEAPL